MNTPNETDTPNLDNPQDKVWQKLKEIANESAGDDYLFRGEPECYSKVSSSLYREFDVVTDSSEIETYNIDIIQKEMVDEAKKFTQKNDEFEILSEIQHHGGKTNLIDFTTDYSIALFFACDGSRLKDGRIILLKKTTQSGCIKQPQNPVHRIISQKSVFVQPVSGYIEPYTEIVIPKELKQPMLLHLRRYHGISTETIYNDVQGFIKHQDIHNSSYTLFYKGLNAQNHGNDQNAIKYYSKAIELNSESYWAFYNRGIAYNKLGIDGKAIRDYTTVLELDPKNARAYNLRGALYLSKGDVIHAKHDYTEAIKLDPEYDSAYYNRGIAHSYEGDVRQALKDFTKSIELNEWNVDAYLNRGIEYASLGKIDLAIQDFTKVIDLSPESADAHYNRGFIWLRFEKWGDAKSDLATAVVLGTNIAAFFHESYGSIPAFELNYGVKIPDEIIDLLTPHQVEP